MLAVHIFFIFWASNSVSEAPGLALSQLCAADSSWVHIIQTQGGIFSVVCRSWSEEGSPSQTNFSFSGTSRPRFEWNSGILQFWVISVWVEALCVQLVNGLLSVYQDSPCSPMKLGIGVSLAEGVTGYVRILSPHIPNIVESLVIQRRLKAHQNIGCEVNSTPVKK